MQSALKNAEDFLAPRGLSLTDLAERVGEVQPWETVLFGGSIPEGLANADSDVDLLLLGHGRVEGGHVVQHCESDLAYRTKVGTLKVQVESVLISHLEMLAARMKASAEGFDKPETVRRAYAFSDADLRILHRVRTGICLKNPEVARLWRERLHTDYLPMYMLVFMIGQHFSRREDAIGEAREGRRESALWHIKHALSHLAGALLASNDETHPYAKWRVRLLQLHREQIEPQFADALVEHLTSPPVGDFRDYVRRAIEFSDGVIEYILFRRAEALSVLLEMQKAIPCTTDADW